MFISDEVNFPKYTSQLINLANQNAQGTRPKVVGQLSEIFPKFLKSENNPNIKKWQKWYEEKYPDTIENATEKIMSQVCHLQEAIKLLDKEMVRNWVKDLVIYKTYNGLYVQKAILCKLSEIYNVLNYRLATPEEESLGIDGYVGTTAYSIKPLTYKEMQRLPETIEVKMIYYEKTKNGLTFETED